MTILQTLTLLSLAISTTLAHAPPAAPEDKVHLAPLLKRSSKKVGVASFGSLFARQAATCPLSSPEECSDGIHCCGITENCCLNGCCQFLYTCDPTGEGTQSQPCVCRGLGCPDAKSGDDDDSTSTMVRSTSFSAAAAAAPTAGVSNPSAAGDAAGVASSSSTRSAGASASTAAAGGGAGGASASQSSATGGGGGGSGAAGQVSSLSAGAMMLLAGLVGGLAFAL